MWILIVVVCVSQCSIAVVPGFYATEQSCQSAVAKFTEDKYSYRGRCIPAPEDIGFE